MILKSSLAPADAGKYKACHAGDGWHAYRDMNLGCHMAQPWMKNILLDAGAGLK
jgi:hypothetical protein